MLMQHLVILWCFFALYFYLHLYLYLYSYLYLFCLWLDVVLAVASILVVGCHVGCGGDGAWMYTAATLAAVVVIVVLVVSGRKSK